MKITVLCHSLRHNSKAILKRSIKRDELKFGKKYNKKNKEKPKSTESIRTKTIDLCLYIAESDSEFGSMISFQFYSAI